MTEREALKLALEALEESHPEAYRHTITAIKEALAEPWEKFCDSNCVWTDHHPDCKLAEQKPLTWIAKAEQMPPAGVRVFWMDKDTNRVGYDTWFGDDFRFTPSHWMHIPPIEAAVWEKQK